MKKLILAALIALAPTLALAGGHGHPAFHGGFHEGFHGGFHHRGFYPGFGVVINSDDDDCYWRLIRTPYGHLRRVWSCDYD